LRAGLVSRFIAGMVDFGLVVSVVLGMYAGLCVVLFLVDPRGFSFPDVPWFVFLEIGFAVIVVYFTAAWHLTGRTIGALLMGLRVVNWRGERMRWSGSFARALFCALFPIGLFWVAFSGANRSLQDVALRTSVIYDWQPNHAHREPHATS
jgi:uncharacterized RDD family membrane protein YckC